MRNRWNWLILALVVGLTAFSIAAVWPGYPKRYLPDFLEYPRGPAFPGLGPDAMRLGLDLQGGTYVLTEADTSVLPAGTDVDEAMEAVQDIINRRVNAFGVAETEVTREGRNRLAIQLPGIPPEEAADLIGRTALLEFKEPVLNDIGEVVCEGDDGNRFSVAREQVVASVSAEGKRIAQCVATGGVTGEVVWTPATAEREGETRVLTGRFVRPGGASVDAVPQPVVLLEFTGEGSLLFEQITTRLQGYPLGIFLDDELIAAPTVRGPISGGNTVIEGLTLEEARELAKLINAGALPVPLRTLQTSEVDATLGEQTLVRAVQAGIIGILAVIAFMILYYRLPGVLASLALITYIAVVMLLFKFGPFLGPFVVITGGMTVTLAGIAGFVLSVGMAVDANILVFERMKEELRAGRALGPAVEHGFDRAWNSIRDSNVSTLITCVILYYFGDQLGADVVKGFAVALWVGVIVSMFSAIVVTRTFLRLLVGSPLARNLWLFAPDISPGRAAQRLAEVRPFFFDFVRRRWLYFAFSALILLPGVVSLLVPPSLKPGIEFTSGATMTLDLEDDSKTQEDVRSALAAVGHPEARVQKTGAGDFIVRISALEGPVGPPVGPPPPSERDQLEEGLEQMLGPFTVKNFNQVSEIVSREIGRNSAIAVGVAAAAILLYISWSFRNVPKAHRYGLAAIIAALHDALFILGAFSIFGKLFGTEISSQFVVGVLTIIGFSVHDTIVVFDRIRENVRTNPEAPFSEVVNASLTETLARSLNTSTTVLFTVVALLLMGAGAINVLLLTLLIGVIAGTYSSIFIAAQILVAWEVGDFARMLRPIIPRRRAEPAEAV